MQNGSLVKMIKNLGEDDKMRLAKYNLKRIPTIGDNIYVVSDFFKRPPNFNGGQNIKDCVSLEEFPEITAQRFFFDADLFREIQSPDEVNIAEVISDSIYVKI